MRTKQFLEETARNGAAVEESVVAGVNQAG
jgi:hypothetical protein